MYSAFKDQVDGARPFQTQRREHNRAAQANVVPMKIERNPGFTITTLIDCIAEIPSFEGIRANAFITAIEKTKKVPAINPLPSIARIASKSKGSNILIHPFSLLLVESSFASSGGLVASADEYVAVSETTGRRGDPFLPVDALNDKNQDPIPRSVTTWLSGRWLTSGRDTSNDPPRAPRDVEIAATGCNLRRRTGSVSSGLATPLVSHSQYMF